MRSVAYTALLALPLLAAAAPVAAQRAPFTGLRVEGNLGWDRLQSDGGHSDDVMYGISGGYDMQMGPALVGIEAGIDDSDNKSCVGAETAADPRICAKAARDIYVGGRVGTVLNPRTLLYAKAGYTNARAKITADDGDDRVTLGHEDLDGVRLGAGAEYAIGPNTYLKAEYRYSNYEQGFSRNQVVGGFGLRF